MTSRPAAVRRYLSGSLWRLGALSALFLLMSLGEWQVARDEDRALDGGYHLTGTVAEDYSGGRTIPVTYDNPLIGETSAKATRYTADKPEAGDEVALDVHRDNPKLVQLEGDRYRPPPLSAVTVLVVLPLFAFALRLLSVRRTSRLTSAPGPAFLMFGTLTLSRLRRGAMLHLFPVDAEPGTAPLCTVRLLTAAGFPLGGPAFRVEVKGSPRAFGRIVARVDERILWPRGRVLARPAKVRLPADVIQPPELQQVDPPDAIQLRSGTWVSLWQLAGCGLAIGVAALVTVITLSHAADARQLERDGLRVIAEITDNHADSSLEVAYRRPDDERRVVTRAPVDFPDEWDVGDRYPAVVDPTNPERLRLLAEPYIAFDPILGAGAAAAAVVGWLLWRLGWRCAARKAAVSGPWYEMDAWIIDHFPLADFHRTERIALAAPGNATPSCRVRLPTSAFRDSVPRPLGVHGHPRQRVLVAGLPSPGSFLAVSVNGSTNLALAPARSAR